MATTSRSTLRGILANELYSTRFTSLTTSSAGNAGGTTLVNTGLINLPGGNDTDFCVGFYVVITSLVAGGPAIGETGKVNAYAAGTGTITLEAALTAQVKNGTTFELHRFDPTDLNTALNRAVELLYPHLYIAKRDETLVVSDRLANSDYESAIAGGAHPSWTNVGAGLTVTAETSRIYHGSQSAKLVEGGTGVAYIYQRPTINIAALAGQTATFKRWVWASAASTARLKIDWDGTAIETGSYHAGDSSWHLLSVSGTVPTTATKVECRVEVQTSGTLYADGGSGAGLFVGDVYRYTVPTSILKGPYSLSIARYEDVADGPFDVIQDYHVEEDSSGRYLLINHLPLQGRILKITGVGILSTMSSDSATTEIDAPRTHLVVARAAQWLYENLRTDTAIGGREMYEAEAARWRERVAELLATSGMRMPRMGASFNQRWSYG